MKTKTLKRRSSVAEYKEENLTRGERKRNGKRRRTSDSAAMFLFLIFHFHILDFATKREILELKSILLHIMRLSRFLFKD